MKDVGRDRREDDDREDGTNDEDRKGASDDPKNSTTLAHKPVVPIDSPVAAHDDLDTAE